MDRQTQKIYLIRHGETEWSRAGKHTGVTDVALTERGRESARLLQPVLARERFNLVLSSPLQRARQTCALAGFENVAVVEADTEAEEVVVVLDLPWVILKQDPHFFRRRR